MKNSNRSDSETATNDYISINVNICIPRSLRLTWSVEYHIMRDSRETTLLTYQGTISRTMIKRS